MIGQDVDDVAARDHLRGGEVFEGLALGGVAGVDAAVDPDAQEDLRFDGLDRAAYGCVGFLPPGDGIGLIGPEDIKACFRELAGLSNSKSRRGKFTADKLQALAALGLEWAA